MHAKQQNHEAVERGIIYTTWNLCFQGKNSTEKYTQEDLVSSKKLGFVVIQKMYIKYKNFKDGLCSKIVCPFCMQKGVRNIS